jgi:hypothetical protein
MQVPWHRLGGPPCVGLVASLGGGRLLERHSHSDRVWFCEQAVDPLACFFLTHRPETQDRDAPRI